MTRHPRPKSSGLYVKLASTGKSKKLSGDDKLWLEVLNNSSMYKNMPDEQVRIQLLSENIKEYLIDVFIASRLRTV